MYRKFCCMHVKIVEGCVIFLKSLLLGKSYLSLDATLGSVRSKDGLSDDYY